MENHAAKRMEGEGMKHRHLNPVIADTLAVVLAVILAATMIYGLFTCHLANYPELW